MTSSHTRRRVLAIVGATGAVSLAGCLSDDDAAADGDDHDDDGHDDGDDEYDDDDHDEYDDGDHDDHDKDEYDDRDGDEEDASVRVAHLSPDAPNVDVYIDDDLTLEDVPFRAVSDYLELPVGTYAVMITAADDPETVVFDEELEVAEGAFTVAALGELEEPNQPFDVAVFEDEVSDPGDDARIRLVHAAPDAPNVDVTAGDGETVLFEDLAFGEADAVEVPAGEYELEVRPATDDIDGDVVATFEVAPAAGGVYTAFAVGYLEPEEAPADEAFDLEVVSDTGVDDDDESDDY